MSIFSTSKYEDNNNDNGNDINSDNDNFPIFQRQTDPLLRAVYEQKLVRPDKTENFLPVADGVKKMRKGFYAFFCELGPCYSLISKTFEDNEKCNLQELVYVVFLDPYYAMQKNSTLREFIRIG